MLVSIKNVFWYMKRFWEWDSDQIDYFFLKDFFDIFTLSEKWNQVNICGDYLIFEIWKSIIHESSHFQIIDSIQDIRDAHW